MPTNEAARRAIAVRDDMILAPPTNPVYLHWLTTPERRPVDGPGLIRCLRSPTTTIAEMDVR